MAPPKQTPAAQPSNTIEALNVKLGNLAAQSKVVSNIADSEGRPLTAAEMADLDAIMKEFNAVENEIKARAGSLDMEDRIRALNEPGRRVTQPDDVEPTAETAPRAARITGGMPVGATKGSNGFRSLGEFTLVARAHSHGKRDARIMNAPSSFGQEGVNEDGGFSVPPDFRSNIMKQILGEESLLSLCDQQTTSSNSLSLPLDTTTPWQTSGGVMPQWVGEGGTITGSKPKHAALDTKLHKLGALVPVTEELMEDAPSLTAWLSSKVPEKFTSFLNDVILNGDGNAKPMGMLNAGSKITCAAVGGQGAGTVVAKNITDMWARCYGPLRRNAYWLINQDIESQLQTMVMPGTTPGYPAYLPPGGLSGAPYATLLGRPVMPMEACQTLGTEGDIILCVPNQYLAVLKNGQGGGMRTDVSIHLYFDVDVTAFRFVMRVGGQSYWPAAIARAHGSNTLSPIITLNSTRT